MNPEEGSDACFDGLDPRPSTDPDPCPVSLPPGLLPPYPGPFKTLRKALDTIAQNPSIGGGPPYVVRIAARWNDRVGAAYVYGDSPGGEANYSEEDFASKGQLKVPPYTLLKADAANSELDPGGAAPCG